MAFNNRYGFLPSAPFIPKQQQQQQQQQPPPCVLCQIPHHQYRTFPCFCQLPIHEECALTVRRQGPFTCPLCRATYAFPLYTPATSVTGDDDMIRPRTEILCHSGRRTAWYIFFLILMLCLGALIMYIFLKYL